MKLAIVYTKDPFSAATSMDLIRWHSLSKALKNRGVDVDMVTVNGEQFRTLESGVRIVPIKDARWDNYDVVKVCYQKTMEYVPFHPKTIVRLARVIGPKAAYRDKVRAKELYKCQDKIAQTAKIVIVNDAINKARWLRLYNSGNEIALLPTGCPSVLPAITQDPFMDSGPVALFMGSISNYRMIKMINGIGKILSAKGWNAVVIGANKTSSYCSKRYKPKKAHCKYIKAVPYERSFAYMNAAHVGVALAPGPFRFENETSRIYYYLRCGLPVACEERIPNSNLIDETGWGKVFKYGDPGDACQAILSLHNLRRDSAGRSAVMDHMASNHSWDCRAQSLLELLITI